MQGDENFDRADNEFEEARVDDNAFKAARTEESVARARSHRALNLDRCAEGTVKDPEEDEEE